MMLLNSQGLSLVRVEYRNKNNKTLNGNINDIYETTGIRFNLTEF